MRLHLSKQRINRRLLVLKTREILVRQRTQAINAPARLFVRNRHYRKLILSQRLVQKSPGQI